MTDNLDIKITTWIADAKAFLDTGGDFEELQRLLAIAEGLIAQVETGRQQSESQS